MQVSVIIINYNTFQLTSACIRSVIEHTRDISYEIIVVDNKSPLEDPHRLKEEFPSITLIVSERNGGFAHGNNLGIQASKGNVILLLNSDTLLQENSIKLTYDFMMKDPAIGICGCRMIYPDGQVQYSSRKFRSISWEMLDLFRFVPLSMSYQNRSRRMMGKYFRHDENSDTDWVNGAFFMIKREVIDKMPSAHLDERFFMYGEDQLWCEQARSLGYTVKFFAGTTIIHINNGSTDISKQLLLRKTMMKNELTIMQERKGKGLYFSLFKAIYAGKEHARNFIKRLFFKSTGKMLR